MTSGTSVFCFDPEGDQKLVFTKRVYRDKDLTPLENWIKSYEVENGRKLKIVVVGNNDVAVLNEGDKIILPGEPLAAKGWVPPPGGMR